MPLLTCGNNAGNPELRGMSRALSEFDATLCFQESITIRTSPLRTTSRLLVSGTRPARHLARPHNVDIHNVLVPQATTRVSEYTGVLYLSSGLRVHPLNVRERWS